MGYWGKTREMRIIDEVLEENMSVNKVMLIGRLTKDPVMKQTESYSVCQMTLVTSRKTKEKEIPQFHNLTAWGKTAELCSTYLTKGSQAYVEGEIQYDSYEKDGQKRYTTKINVSNVRFLDGKKDAKPAPQQSFPQQSFDTDSIPF